jgi:CheY-like chemotaxis protein
MSTFPILLVEDDENDVFFFERAAEKANFNCPLHIVRDGDEAVAYLQGDGAFANREQFPLPCLIVLDLNLPHKHGLEVLQWIRASAPDPTVPVVILTSSTSDVDLREAYRFGANSYLNKPSLPQGLDEMLRTFKAYWFGMNRVPPASAPPTLRSNIELARASAG